MRSFFIYLLIGFLSFGLVVNEASAKRFGGGRSFGVQRSHSSLFSPRATPQPMKSLGQRANSNKWRGVLGGLLAGSLLASLFMGNGLGSGLLSWLILGSIAFFLINFFRRRMQPGLQSAQTAHYGKSSFNNQNSQFYAGSANNNFSNYPRDFDSEAFLRDAKVKFIRLQAAYDQKNLQDLNDFTAPEVFAEIKMQLDERGQEPNKTEVINLNAQLLDVSRQADSTMASVRFTGVIKENQEPAIQFDEIWHFRQFFNNQAWVVGGIQQDVYQPQ
ncbi:transmembrane protein [Legionella nautarum]|uniref:Transmembrane protein n=1 Tax=Legionella nautarum TaxID=45070 RepID=A0A0W0WWR9_9GAMM|nr:transporter [Legionella nautarum]KTD36775.1 transmembrane protein [Legionella nautarum]